MTATDWAPDAPCREIGHGLYFADDDGRNTYDLARRICNHCPHRAACLNQAMTAEGDSGPEMRAGMWGGLTPTQRHHLHKRRTRQHAEQVAA